MSDSMRPPFFSGDFGEHETNPRRSVGLLPPIGGERPRAPRLTSAIAIGFAMASRRLYARRFALAMLLGIALVIAGGFIERRTSSGGAIDRSLRGAFGLVLPLVTFAAVIEATGRKRLADATWPAARYGASRRGIALGIVLAAALGAALLGAFLAGCAVLAAATSTTPASVPDVLVSARIGALTAVAYVGWFAVGATFFDRGRGAWIPLVSDFLVGGTTGILGAVFPRGNAKNLLGDVSPAGLLQSSSSVILIGTALVLGVAAALRCRDS